MEETPTIAFFGTSSFAVTQLEYLEQAGLLPTLIITQPDKPKGRKMVMTPPPVKEWALEKEIPFIQPESLDEIPDELNGEWDVFVVVAYGKFLPENILELSNSGALNVHPSLLPKLRGPAPVHSAILQDEKHTGVTIMKLDKEMDHGPIIAQASVDVENWPPEESVLEDLLANVGGELLTDSIIPWINGDIEPEEQNHEEATYCKLIKKEDALIDLNDDDYKNYLKIQAFSSWPVAYFFVKKGDKDIRVKISEANFENGKLAILKVIPEGKKEMNYEDFKRGLVS